MAITVANMSRFAEGIMSTFFKVLPSGVEEEEEETLFVNGMVTVGAV